MLDRLRKNQDNFVFSLLIIAIVAVMALYGINQLNSEPSSGGAAAWVNGEAIPNREFREELERTLEEYRGKLGTQLDERFIAQFQIPQRKLEELIQYKLLSQQAYRLGFRVPDEELASFIRKAPAFQRNGRFDPELYRRIPNRGQEEKRIREGLLIRQMQTYLSHRVEVPLAMLDAAYQLRETKVNLAFARIDFKALANKSKPSEGAIAAFLKTTPVDQLQAYYNSHQREYTQPAAVHLRQIRVGIPFQASTEKKDEARKKIEAIAKELTAENFESVARKQSDDEHAKKGGDAGWVNRGTLEPALEQALNQLEPGHVSAPVETPFGYYLLLISEKRPESTRPLEEAKRDVARALWQQKKEQEVVDLRKTQWEKLLAAGQGIEKGLKESGIEVKKTGPFSLGQGFIPQIGQSDEVLDAVFNLTKAKPVAPKLYLVGTDYYYVRLESVEPPKRAKYETDITTVDSGLETALQSTFLSKWMEELKESASIRIEVKFDG